MEPADEALMLAVERARRGIVVVRVTGDLCRGPLARLARLLDTYTTPMSGTTPGEARLSHLVVDLGEVRTFGVAGLQVIRRAEQACTRTSISLHVTGVAARLDALPLHVGAMLADFSCFGTVEEALDALPAAAGPISVDRVVNARQHARRRPRTRLVVDGG